MIELDQQYTKKQERFQYDQMQKYATKLRTLKQELELDQAGALALFKRLYLTRKGADKIFIEASDKDNEEAKGAEDETTQEDCGQRR